MEFQDPPTDRQAAIRALIAQWRVDGPAAIREAEQKGWPIVATAIAARLICANELEDLLRALPPEPQAADRIRVLEQAVGNCFIMARRQIAAHLNGTNTPAKDLERWQHVQRFCETTGSKSDILRGQLPNEMTDGARALPPEGVRTDVWIVGQGADIRGVHASHAAAEQEIADICREHPDLQRSDFCVYVDRIRSSSSAPRLPQERTGQ